MESLDLFEGNMKSDGLPRIMIAAPVRNRGWILPSFFYYLYYLVYPKDRIALYFILNDSTDNTQDLLVDFSKNFGGDYHRMLVDKMAFGAPDDTVRSHATREQHTYRNLAILRNKIVDVFLTSDCDKLCMLDTDIMVTPFSLHTLVASGKDAVSAWIPNDYGRGTFGNVMKFDGPSSAVHITGLPFSYAPVPVDLTGAFFLLHRKCLSEPVPRFDYHIQGEDIPFCIGLKNKGVQAYTIKANLAIHRMSK